jgi:hypothetical protein
VSCSGSCTTKRRYAAIATVAAEGLPVQLACLAGLWI